MRSYGRGWMLALMVLVGMSACAELCAQAGANNPEDAAIQAAIHAQVVAWNKGDIPAFMATYENSPETTFVGATSVNKGFQPILERYKKAYATREQMGTLSFSDLDVRLLPASTGMTEYAVMTGRFHLARSTKGEATKDDGIFSLVWHKSNGSWKIVLDHTS